MYVTSLRIENLGFYTLVFEKIALFRGRATKKQENISCPLFEN